MSNYHKIIPAVYLILSRDKQILLQRRFKTGYEDGNYSLPGGHFEGNETAQQVAIREAKEELGVAVKQKDLEFVHLMHRMSNSQERIDITFLLKNWKGRLINAEPNKCDQISWFSLTKLPVNTIPCIKQVINSVENKIIYSEFGWQE